MPAVRRERQAGPYIDFQASIERTKWVSETPRVRGEWTKGIEKEGKPYEVPKLLE